MAKVPLDPVEYLRRRQRRAEGLLTVLEIFHYLLAAPALLVSVGVFFAAASAMVERMGNWGVTSGWDMRQLAFSIAGLAYGLGTVYSTRLMERRRRRGFSRAWATAHLFTVIGAPLALLTWAVLSLRSVRELYDGSAPTFEPRLRPPPVPVPVLPVVAGEVSEDSAVAGG